MAADKSDVAAPVDSSAIQYHFDDDSKMGSGMAVPAENSIDEQLVGGVNGSIAEHSTLATKDKSRDGEDHAAKVLDKADESESAARLIFCWCSCIRLDASVSHVMKELKRN